MPNIDTWGMPQTLTPDSGLGDDLDPTSQLLAKLQPQQNWFSMDPKAQSTSIIPQQFRRSPGRMPAIPNRRVQPGRPPALPPGWFSTDPGAQSTSIIPKALPGGIPSLSDLQSTLPSAAAEAAIGKTLGPRGNVEAKASDSFENKTDSKKNLYADADQYQQWGNTVGSLPEFKEQKEGVDKLENMFNMQKQMLGDTAGQMDLSPLAALTDTWTGSHLREGYTPPETPQNVAKYLSSYAEKIQDKRQQLLKDKLENITKLKVGQEANENLLKYANIMSQGIGGRMPAPNNTAAANTFKWSQQYNGDKQLQTANSALAAGSELQQFLTQNTSADAFLAKIKLMRTEGLNRITNFEMKDFQGDKSFGNQVNQALTTLMTGELTPENVANFKKAAAILTNGASKIKQERMAYYKNLGRQTGVPTDTLLSPLGNQAPISTTEPAGPKGIHPALVGKTPEQLKQMLEEAKKNGK